MKGNDHPMATAKWAAESSLALFESPEDVTAPMIRRYIKAQWDITMSYQKAHIAKMIIHEIMCWNAKASYRILPAYADELPRGDDTFGRFFWSFGPSISAFNQTVRPLALIDETHLRGKYRGSLLVATAIYGNNGLFPLALTVVEPETYDNWVWFLHLFSQNFISAGRDVITIGSDRMKGLPRAVAEALPGSHHFYCIHYLSANFHGNFKSEDLQKLFVIAAYSLREGAFKNAMESIKSMSKSAEKWISEIPKQNWANTYFEGSRYNVLTTNTAESFNALLKGSRELPIAALVEQTRWRIFDFFQYRQKAGSKWTTRLTPNAEDWLADECILAGGYMVHQYGWTVYEVKSKYHVDEVDIEKKTCTCRLFQTMGMSCSHAIAVM
ncbi:uncharacterized protein LOC143891123 [Tasmannia lanceolata]|uniref:uncharacterized protein LOC143891123 n=1 Tax=Tasmannia lanceolata TaxID=3420 RepID=UPI0040632827